MLWDVSAETILKETIKKVKRGNIVMMDLWYMD
jgi:hypothetical protein